MEKSIVISKRALLFLVALAGFVATVVLAVVYFNANFNPDAAPSFCTSQQNPIINCDGVAKSPDAQFLGIPLAYWGMLYYVIVMVLLGTEKLKNIKFLSWMEVFKNPLSYIATLGCVSFVVSMICAYVSVVNLKMVCVLCVVTYFINFLIALMASELSNETFAVAFKRCVDDFVAAIKIKKYAVAFLACVVVGIAFLTVTTTTYVFAPQVKDAKVMKEIYEMQTNKYANVAKGNFLGDENAELVVYEYSDFMCPYCVMENRLFHKAIKDLENVRVEFVNYPLDKACNKNIPNDFHVGACDFAKIAVAAKKQNKFWKAANTLFESKTQSVDQMYSLLAKEGLNIDKLKADVALAETKQEVLNNIDTATEINVAGTPAFSVDGQLYVGLKPYSELKEILIDAGARPRRK